VAEVVEHARMAVEEELGSAWMVEEGARGVSALMAEGEGCGTLVEVEEALQLPVTPHKHMSFLL
jgi:hypothetical protein